MNLLQSNGWTATILEICKKDGNDTKPVVISEEVLFELQLAKTVMAALRGHYPDLGQTRILDIAGTYQNKDSIEGMIL